VELWRSLTSVQLCSCSSTLTVAGRGLTLARKVKATQLPAYGCCTPGLPAAVTLAPSGTAAGTAGADAAKGTLLAASPRSVAAGAASMGPGVLACPARGSTIAPGSAPAPETLAPPTACRPSTTSTLIIAPSARAAPLPACLAGASPLLPLLLVWVSGVACPPMPLAATSWPAGAGTLPGVPVRTTPAGPSGNPAVASATGVCCCCCCCSFCCCSWCRSCCDTCHCCCRGSCCS